MKLIFTCGGTGGHVSPAIGIAEYARSRYNMSDILFVGRTHGNENKAIKKRNFKIYEIDISAPKTKPISAAIKYAFKLISAIKVAKNILKEYKPDAVIGTGGYVSYPILYAARRMNIPIYIHESNAYPGRVTRLMSKSAERVFLNIEDASRYFKNDKNVYLVGNPILSDFGKIKKSDARRHLKISENTSLIVSFGGSGGAERINREMINVISRCKNENKMVNIIHACGEKYFPTIKKEHPDLFRESDRFRIIPYIENMPELLAAADLVISRSGAMSCTELAASGAAAILIPSPNVKDNHQYKNAEYYSSKGAARLIEENEISDDKLYNEIFTLLNNKTALIKMRSKIAKTYNSNAARDICEAIYQK